jgi:ribonuclease-3
MSSVSDLEDIIHVSFTNPDLLYEALTHRSYLNETDHWPYRHNERLEYLGDAVLELVVTHALFLKYPNFSEGQLTVLRAALVNYQFLAKITADDLHLQDFLHMSKGEAKDTGKAREVILANAFEALVGAIYLDRGYDVARQFIEQFVLPHTDEILKTKSYKDPKSQLQELTQERFKITPSYHVLSEHGPAHQRIFSVGVYLLDRLVASGEGASKQEAETDAAKNALDSSLVSPVVPKKKGKK